MHGPVQENVLRHISKLAKLFSTYASERPFEFLLMRNAPTVVHYLKQICQHEAEQFNNPADQTDDQKTELLSKIVIRSIQTVRSLLVAVADPKVFDKGIVSEIPLIEKLKVGLLKLSMQRAILQSFSIRRVFRNMLLCCWNTI
jgi:hypothetical protein